MKIPNTELVPPDVEKDLRSLYLSVNELLKHFWHAFPPTTADSEAKAVRMHEALQRFQMAKLKPFEVGVFGIPPFSECNKFNSCRNVP